MSRRRRMMESLDEDIRDHIAIETQENIEGGMSPREARSSALRKFGNVTRITEETWEVWSISWLEQFFGARLSAQFQCNPSCGGSHLAKLRPVGSRNIAAP